MPGIGISTEALYQKAAKLPRIELVRPRSVIGSNPVTSMQAGVFSATPARWTDRPPHPQGMSSIPG